MAFISIWSLSAASAVGPCPGFTTKRPRNHRTGGSMSSSGAVVSAKCKVDPVSQPFVFCPRRNGNLLHSSSFVRVIWGPVPSFDPNWSQSAGRIPKFDRRWQHWRLRALVQSSRLVRAWVLSSCRRHTPIHFVPGMCLLLEERARELMADMRLEAVVR